MYVHVHVHVHNRHRQFTTMVNRHVYIYNMCKEQVITQTENVRRYVEKCVTSVTVIRYDAVIFYWLYSTLCN